MGPGLNFETPEEIQRIVIEADGPPADGSPADGPPAETPSPQKTTKKRKRKGPREDNHTSEVWAHFTRGPKDNDGSLDASCNYCGKKYKQGNQRSTSSLWHHFERGCHKVPRSKRVKPDALQRLLQAGKATAAAADGPNPAVWKTTVRADCLSIYEDEKLALYEFFSQLDCRFSFTSDLWTSKGNRGFMALTCHYIDDAWKLRKRLIGFIALPSPHTGKHIAQAIHELLVLWNLDKKAFSLVLDNSSANDASITELFNTTSIKKDLPVSGAIFHQRCAFHILNLIVQDGLSVLCDEIENVRETMKYIRHSQARMEKFSLAVGQVGAPNKRPAWDVQTRWNSTYLMLELALELREAINRYATLDKRYKLTVVKYYMEQMYPEDSATFIFNMKNCMNKLFKEYVQAHSRMVQNQAGSSTQQLRSSSAPAELSDTRAGLRDAIRAQKSAEPGMKSELEEYFTEPLDEASIDDQFDILAWWKVKAPKYHVLARLTRDILAIPISTVASEATFSTSGRTLNPGRSSLNDESIEALVCAQDWLKAAVIENGGELGDPLWPNDGVGAGADASATLC
ncbi:hypothetical protein LUZ63_012243 [Rhynchospora breviuscula]|uniref:BED-type domain-containing protein n=1 Tax=Rhynchospora breviuscula TaxID=2022672 RepID=A0A9Q0CKE8_9POAL|nr:hypothetical protein LUZ63_012243 [Rhynchospora breviuscula]